MKKSIFERFFGGGGQKLAGTLAPDNAVLMGLWDVEHHVAMPDGRYEVRKFTKKNIVTSLGQNRLADLGIAANVVSAFAYIVVGTNTASPADTDTQANMGEVTNGRKIAAVKVQSREWMALTATWAGATDALTGIALDSAGVSDYQNSSAATGILGNRVNGLGVTLAASDFLNLTVRIRVGSHNNSHTT